jgi:phage terminase small subunit
MVKAQTALNKLETDANVGGMLYKTVSGNIIQNPLVGIVNTAQRDMCKYASEMGITPASRSNVSGRKIGESHGWE